MTTEKTDAELTRERMLRLVFSDVAHDLKTPLSCIISALQTLDQLGGKLSDAQRKTLITTALSEAHRLDTLFGAMLEQAKP